MKTILAALLMLSTSGAVAEVRALFVAGLGGEAGYEQQFQRQAKDSARALSALAPDVTVLVGAAVDRARMQEALGSLAARSDSDDDLIVMLVGHGSYDGRDYRFNVPGADVTGQQLTGWLDAVPARRQLVVVATSASGALLPGLDREGRTVITATRSGGERNVTVFGRYFSASLNDPSADVDKDGYVSAAEAFGFAESAVASFYRDRDRMATEHPALGGPASEMRLARLREVPAFETGGAADRQRLSALQARIEALRADKANLSADAYYAELQRLMLEMARLRQRVGEGGEP